MHRSDENLPETLARDDADGFDIALRLRRDHGTDVFELVVNGMFAMDSVDASSEVALARLVPAGARRVLVGGLGLGFTAGTVLDEHPSADVTVVELSSGLITWARKGFVPSLAHVAGNPRARLVHADIKDVLGSSPSHDSDREGSCEPASSGAPERTGGPRGSSPSHDEWDAILLDVDNGPSFLIHDHNEGLYEDDLLASAFGQLAPGGLLAIWCEQFSPELDERLRQLDPAADVVTVPVDRDGHHIDYAIHCARR